MTPARESAPVTGRRVVVAGQGYVGLPLAMRAVEAGHDVVGYEPDAERAAWLAGGQSYVEDVESERVAAALGTGRYRVVSGGRDDRNGEDWLGTYDVAVITVPTPLRDGAPDLSFIEACGHTLGRRLRAAACVILESTTYPGTTEELLAPILEQESGLKAGRDFHLGYSPERIDPGSAHWRLETTPKVVSGIDPASLAVVQGFYDSLVETTVPVSGPAVAELSKLMENTFRHVNIALVNEMAMFAADLGIDVWEAIDAASTKPFGYMRFTPGPGVGGHCLPIDPSYLSWRVNRRLGQRFRFVELANDINDHMPDYVVDRLAAGLNRLGRTVKDSRVLLLGLAYKRNTSDARESPALAVADRLLALEARVAAADPHVVEGIGDARILRVEASEAEARTADAVVVLTDHDVFDLPVLAGAARYVLDTRHCLGPLAQVEYL